MQFENQNLSTVQGYVTIIPAAGSGQRFGTQLPKQYQPISGKPLLAHTLEIFIHSKSCEKIILVVSAQDQAHKKLAGIQQEKIIVIEGGSERQHSVHNGLKYLFDNGLPPETPLLIHDAVRPCLSKLDLNRLIEHFKKTKNACFLASKLADSIKQIGDNFRLKKNINRDELLAAQTPQMAKFIDMKRAFISSLEDEIIGSDDVTLLSRIGLEVDAVIANDPNFKVTQKIDLDLATLVLAQQGRI